MHTSHALTLEDIENLGAEHLIDLLVVSIVLGIRDLAIIVLVLVLVLLIVVFVLVFVLVVVLSLLILIFLFGVLFLLLFVHVIVVFIILVIQSGAVDLHAIIVVFIAVPAIDLEDLSGMDRGRSSCQDLCIFFFLI